MCKMSDAALARYGDDRTVPSSVIRAFCDGWNACADAMGEQYQEEKHQNNAMRGIFNAMVAPGMHDTPDLRVLPFPGPVVPKEIAPEVLAAAMQCVLNARASANRVEAMLREAQTAYNLGDLERM